jgi:hypothetical protein
MPIFFLFSQPSISFGFIHPFISFHRAFRAFIMFSPSFLPSFLFLYIHYNPGRANFCGPLDRSLLALIVAQAEPHRFCGPQDTYPGRGRGFAQVLTQFAAQSNFYCCEYPLSPDLTNDADRDHLVASNPSQAVQSRAEQSRARQSGPPHTIERWSKSGRVIIKIVASTIL